MSESGLANSHSNKRIRVAVCGAKGKMGREVVKTILSEPQLALAGVVDSHALNETVNDFFGVQNAQGMRFDRSLKELLHREQPDVCVDFTNPDVVFENTMTIIQAGCRPVIGTTGLTTEQLGTIDEALKKGRLGGLVIPNFAIGAVLLMKFAQEAAKYFANAEIIELHHNRKADAPSGTALKTAALMLETRDQFGADNAAETESITSARGAIGPADIRIHSVRLPGFIAHQEVIFGSTGQILTLRHDSMDRACFMPGVVLAIEKSLDLTGLIYGLEHIL